LPRAYDLIVSSMVLHHVQHVDRLLAQFHQATLPGGHLCLADLDSDDGQFHSDNQGVFHFGFDHAGLRQAFAGAGFTNIQVATAAEMLKLARDGGLRRFTIFLMTGSKGA